MIEVCSKYKNTLVQVKNRTIHFQNGSAWVTPVEAEILIHRDGYYLKGRATPPPNKLSDIYPKPDRTAPIKFSISIICHNQFGYTKRCIEHVLNTVKYNYEIIVMNNASSDGTREYLDNLQKTEKNITVVHNTKNLGFMLPNIEALKLARGEYFVLLNNDLFVEDPLWLEILLSGFTSNDKVRIVGAVGGKLNPDGSGAPNKLEHDYIEGSCMAISTAFAREIGLFDTSLYTFAYQEDSDLSLRVREMGYLIKQVNIKHHHFQGSTTKTNLTFIKKMAEQNRKNFRKRWNMYLTRRVFRDPIFIDQLYPFDRERFMKAKNVILAREVGIGDVLFFSTVATWMKKVNKKCRIVFATKDEHMRILDNHPFIDEVVPYEKIKDKKYTGQFDYGLHFVPFYRNTGLVDMDELKDHSIEIIQGFFNARNWDPTIFYFVKDIECKWAEGYLKNRVKHRKIVTVVVSCQDYKRDNPYILDIAKYFSLKGHCVILLNKNKVNPQYPSIINLTGQTDIGQAGAIIEKSDLIVTPDTGLMHIAGALGKPIITWCTSFPSKVRMKYYSTYYAFELWKNCQYGPCRFNYDIACKDRFCYKTLPPKTVYDKAVELKYI